MNAGVECRDGLGELFWFVFFLRLPFRRMRSLGCWPSQVPMVYEAFFGEPL